MRNSFLRRLIVFVSVLSLLAQTISPYVVYAQETTPTNSPTPTVEQSTTPTETPAETVTPTPDQIQPTDSITPTPTNTPIDTVTPTPTEVPTTTDTPTVDNLSPPSTNSSSTQTVEGAQTSITPTETPAQAEPTTKDEELSATILKNVAAPSLNLETQVSEGSATLTTDKADYAPTDTALITGSNLLLDTTYSLTISSSDEPPTSTTINITSNNSGTFLYAYQLDGTYRPNYKVELKDSFGTTVATTTFTDSDVRNFSSSITPTTSLTAQTQTYTATFSNSVSSNKKIKSAKLINKDGFTSVGTFLLGGSASSNWSVSLVGNEIRMARTSPAGDIDSNQSFTITFNATAPSSTGSKEWTARAWESTDWTDKEFAITTSQPQVTVSALDTTSPTVGVSGAPGSWVNSDQTAGVTCSDVDSGCNSATKAIKVYNSDPGSCSTTYSDYTVEATQTISAHKWVCTAEKDNASTPNTGFSSPVEFEVDKTVPTVSAAISAGTLGSNGWYTSNVTVQFTCSDTGGSGIASCPANQILSTEGSSVSSTAETATDNAGNTSGLSNVVTVNIDKTLPSGTISSPPDGSLFKGTVTVDADALDGSGSGVDKVEFYHNISPITLFGTDTTAPYSADWSTTAADDGNHALYIRVSDMAGNVSSDIGGPVITIDNTAPTTTIGTVTDGNSAVVSSGGFTKSDSISIPFTTDDGIVGSGVTGSECQLDSDPYSPSCTSPFTTGGLSDGSHTVNIRSTDAAGNVESTATFTWNVDTIAPTITVDTLTTNNTSPGLSGTIDDDDATISLTVDGNTYGDAYTNGDGTWSLDAGTIDPALSDGTYDVSVSATDAAGNVGNDTTTDELIIDTIDPTVTVDSLLTNDNTPTLTGTVNDASASINVTVDGNTYSASNNSDGTWTLTDDTVSPLIDGTYDVTITATDDAGNIGNDGTSNELVIDTVAPAAPTASPAGESYYSDQTVTLTAEAGAQIRYTTNGTTPTDSTGTVYSGTIPVGVDTVIKAIAIDSAGNVSPLMTETYEIAPIISNEALTRVNDTSLTATWLTDDPATSRVIYDTVSHASAVSSGDVPFDKYGYANTTDEFDTGINKTTSHSVSIAGLTTGVTYYYRVISHGSPEAVGSEQSFTVNYVFGLPGDGLTPAGGGAPSGGGGAGATAGVLGIATGPSLISYGNVLGAQVEPETQVNSSNGEVLATESASPTIEEINNNVLSQSGFFGSFLFYGILFLILLLLSAFIYYFYKRRKRKEEEK